MEQAQVLCSGPGVLQMHHTPVRVGEASIQGRSVGAGVLGRVERRQNCGGEGGGGSLGRPVQARGDGMSSNT